MSSAKTQSDSTKKIIKRKKIPSKYLDQLKFELDVPAAECITSNVQKTVICGFFKWTFSLINLQKDHEYIKKKLKSRQNARRKYARKKEKKRAAKLRKPRQGFLLSAECEPDSENTEGNPKLAVSRWKVNAMIVPNWKKSNLEERKEKRRRVKETDRGWLFTDKVSWHGIKHFSPLAFRLQKNVFVIKLRVLRISSLNPTAFGPDLAEGPFKICLNIGNEQIYVERTFLEFHSTILPALINGGKGTSKQNPIRLENRFKPSLVKLAFRVVGLKSAFYVSNIPELLDFATTYGFHSLLHMVEQRLVTKTCAKLQIGTKLDLAYKHRMNGLIVAVAKRINKPTEIERHLEMKNVPAQFKTMLRRKMEAIRARVFEIGAKSKEKRERKKEKREKRKSKKDAGNAEVKNGLKKLKLSD
ncbi:hypothetical protein niasHT_023860 [Heterodera trifolii]|uniref:BTB domain-containing protein n=1 Tax=Heterodera trifolii TaxID=157864 RepID=A0ABD2JCI1_9BILA